MDKNNKFLQKIYLSSPSWIKSIMATLYSWKVSRKKYGKIYEHWRNKLKETERYSTKDLNQYQNKLAYDYFTFLNENSAYFKDYFTRYKIDFSAPDFRTEIKKLPVITKKDVLEDYEDILISEQLFDKRYKFSSSGTTGRALSVYLDQDAYEREYAFRMHYLSIAGMERKKKTAYFLGNRLFADKNKPPFHICDYFENGIYFSIFHLSDQTIKYYVNAFNKYKPEFIKGYPSALYSLAYLAKENGLDLTPLKGIFSASEMLHDFQKELLEDVFKTKVYQWYGQVETTVNIHECEHGKFHIKEEYGFLELLNQKGEDAQPGEEASVIGTSWGNRAFPLLRYDTGDNMILAENQECACGRNGRIIEKIIGRDEDVIITPDGKHIGRLDFVFKPVHTVIESQIVQLSKNEILVNVVPAESFSKDDENLIIETLQKYVGDLFKISLKLVDQVERTKSGKIRYVVNKINK